jgi:predicted XRE-type DNA-binding protein
MKREKRVSNVWDAIADSPAEAASLRIRAELMEQIAVLVEKKGWTQAQAAKQCGISQPRMNDLLRGRISRFSLDALVDAATALGCRVRMELRAA